MGVEIRSSKTRNRPYADVAAVAVLLSLSALYGWLSWGRWQFWGDQGRYMQVAARVAAGEVLYRDVYWAYGPLPAHALALLYQWLGVQVSTVSLLNVGLATLACLLTYRVARFLLPAPLALLGTVAVFLGGQQRLNIQWGGFFAYLYAYSGAVSLGAVLGLAFVASLLSYLKNRRVSWLIAAGLATGGALLSKPEFALACAGTGLLLLSLDLLFPAGPANRRDKLAALVLYAASAAAVAGLGYGLVVSRSGWEPLRQGISGYGQAGRLMHKMPPWGTPGSWLHIAGGLGAYLLALAALLVTMLAGRAGDPPFRKLSPRWVLLLGALAVGGLLLIVPWGLGFFSRLGDRTLPLASFLMEEGNRVLWAPGTLVAACLILALGVRWFRTYRRGQTPKPAEWYLTALLVYSALAAARFYFNPTGLLLTHYADTLFPVLLFALLVLVSRVAERWGTGPWFRWGTALAVALVIGYAIAGFALDAATLSAYRLEVTTPRGVARIYDTDQRSPYRKQIEVLEYILSHSEPEDPIAVLTNTPTSAAFYFLSGRRNPFPHEAVRPWTATAQDVADLVRRMEERQPKLVIVYGQPVDGGPLPVRPTIDSYGDFGALWLYLAAHYQASTVIGEATWGYAILEPLGPNR